MEELFVWYHYALIAYLVGIPYFAYRYADNTGWKSLPKTILAGVAWPYTLFLDFVAILLRDWSK